MDWLLHFFSWYVYMSLIGLVFFPITKKLFGKTLDGGFALSKALGILLTTYAVLVLGITRLVPFGKISIIAILLAVAFFSYKTLIQKGFKNIAETLENNRGLMQWVIFEEVLFFGGLLLWTIVRSQEPSIHGLEKFMDFGFMQSISRSQFFPPLDMWYSADLENRPNGYFINYYYFGHLSGALLIKLTGVPAAVGYNLVLANLFGIALSMGFSIVVNLIHFGNNIMFGVKKVVSRTKLMIYGVIGALILNTAGNWHTIYLFTKGYENEHPVPPWTVLPNLKDLFGLISQKFPNVLGALGEYSHYWYPNATRFIPNTIHEFPSYSYVVADLHGHVFDIPFVLLTLAVILFVVGPKILAKWGVHLASPDPAANNHKHKDHIHLSNNSDNQHLTLQKYEHLFTQIFGDGFITKLLLKCIASSVPITLLLGFLTAVHYMTNAFDGPIYLMLAFGVLFLLHGVSIAFLVNILMLAFGFIYFSLPFSVFFEPFVSGIGVNCAFPLVSGLAKAGETSVKLGPFLFEKGNCQLSAVYQLVILWGFFWMFGLILALVMYLTRRYIRKSQSSHGESLLPEKRSMPFDALVGLVYVFGTILIIIPEFFYIKDIYPTHFRANTMFKMGYQAYMMMSLTAMYVFWRLQLLPKAYEWVKRTLTIASISSILLVLVYMNFAVQSYYGNFTRPIKLDGIAWLKDQYPDTLEIVEFFNTKVTGQPVILEAQGDSYTDYNAVSAYTGLPTIAGWWVHEWLWRGTADIVGSRIPHIEAIYQSDDVLETRRLLRRFKVEYVVISSHEHKKYDVDDKKINEKKFVKLGEEVFRTSDGKGVVYKVH